MSSSGLLAQKRHGAAEAGLVEGHEDDNRTGASHEQRLR